MAQITLKPEELDHVLHNLMGVPQPAPAGPLAAPPGGLQPANGVNQPPAPLRPPQVNPGPPPPIPGRSLNLPMLHPMSPLAGIGQPVSPGHPPSFLHRVAGTLGNIGHDALSTLKTVGEAGGMMFAPEAMMMVPGTPLHKLLQLRERELSYGPQIAQAQAGAAKAHEQILQQEAAGGLGAEQVKMLQAQIGMDSARAQQYLSLGENEKAQALENRVRAAQQLLRLNVEERFLPGAGEGTNAFDIQPLGLPNESPAQMTQGMQHDQQVANRLGMLAGADPLFHPEFNAAEQALRSGYPLGREMNPSRQAQQPAPHTLTRYHFFKDSQGNLQEVPYQEQLTPGIGGNFNQAPINTGLLTPLPGPINSDLSELTTTMDSLQMLQQELSQLEQQYGNSSQARQKLRRMTMNTLYSSGFAPESSGLEEAYIQLANLAQLKGMNTYATKSRNYQYLKDIKAHLPKASDTLELAQQKLNTLMKIYPMFIGDYLSTFYGPENARKFAKLRGWNLPQSLFAPYSNSTSTPRIATNPKTGERVIFIGGKWLPLAK